MAASDEAWLSDLGSFDRKRTHGDIRLVIAIVAVLDVMVIAVSLILAWDLRVAFDIWSQVSPRADILISQTIPWLMAGWLLALATQGAYAARHFAAGAEEYRSVLLACLITAGALYAVCYLVHIPLSRGFGVMAFLVATPLLFSERYLVRKIVHRMRMKGRLLHRVIAIGGPSGVSEVVDALRRERYVGYEVVGACVPDGVATEPARFSVPVVGSVADARRMCDELGADTILVARGGYASSRELRRIAWDLEGSTIDLVVVPSLTDVAGPRIQMRPVAGLPLLHVEQPLASDAAGVEKRAFDIVGAVLGLLLISPLMLLVALLIKLEDRGHVLYRQPRIGRDGSGFGCYKFRSMIVDAERLEQKMRDADAHEGALWKQQDDPRTTRIGKFIRRYSIDELPQLFNVLQGDMSLVGPRPQQAWEVETYTDWEGRRLRVRPGMTGLWQVSGRSQLSFDEAIRLDLYYVDNWSMTTDLAIVVKTLRAVVGKTGAY